MEKGRFRIISLFEIISGILIVAGLGGMFSWLTYESARLWLLRIKIESDIKAYQEIANSLASKQKELDDPLKQLLELSKKFQEFDVVEKTEYGRRQTVIVRGAGKVFFQEDFTNFRLGDIPTEWGNGLGIAGDDKHRFLHGMSSTPGQLGKKIDFPQNFYFHFSMYNIVINNWRINFKDVLGNTIYLERWKGIGEYGSDMKLTGAETIRLRDRVGSDKKWYVLGIEIHGETVRVDVNGVFISASRFSGIKNFVRLEINAEPWNEFYIDSFYGIDLGEEVEPKR